MMCQILSSDVVREATDVQMFYDHLKKTKGQWLKDSMIEIRSRLL